MVRFQIVPNYFLSRTKNLHFAKATFPGFSAMVKDIANYEWSSYWHNALGQTDKLITKHQLYKDLGASAEQRGERYRKIFDTLNITK
jgi:hypothetical protein